MTNSASDRASSWQRMLADARGAASVAEAREQLPSPLPRMLTGRRESRSRSATFGYWSTASEGGGPLAAARWGRLSDEPDGDGDDDEPGGGQARRHDSPQAGTERG